MFVLINTTPLLCITIDDIIDSFEKLAKTDKILTFYKGLRFKFKSINLIL